MRKQSKIIVAMALVGLSIFTPEVAQAKPLKAVRTYFVVSRIESNRAVLEAENGKEVEINRSKLPKRAKEGEVLSYFKGKYRRDTRKTRERKKRIEAYMQNFF